MLLDNDQADVTGEIGQAFDDFFHHPDPDALGRFIEQEQGGIAQQGAANGQHFALTAAEGAGRLRQPFAGLGKEGEHPLDGLLVGIG